MSFKRTASAIAAALLLAGCSTAHGDTVTADPAFGEAVKYNAAIQTINPDPVYAPAGAQPRGDADRGVAAMERYREGTVTDVQEVTTTTSSTGGGGSR